MNYMHQGEQADQPYYDHGNILEVEDDFRIQVEYNTDGNGKLQEQKMLNEMFNILQKYRGEI